MKYNYELFIHIKLGKLLKRLISLHNSVHTDSYLQMIFL